MYLLIVFLPLLGSSVAGFFGRFLGSEGAKEKEAYNLSNLWLLEKQLNKPKWVKSVLIPFLLEFGKKGGRELDLGVRAKTKYKVLFSFRSLLSFGMILYEFFLSKLS
jgi:hypothetical protein